MFSAIEDTREDTRSSMAGLSSRPGRFTHLCGQRRLLNSLTEPDVHVLNSSWKLIHASHPVLELRGRRGEKWGGKAGKEVHIDKQELHVWF